VGRCRFAADLSRVARGWGDAGEPREPVRVGEGVHVSAGDGEELGSQQGADTGHAGDYFGVAVLAPSMSLSVSAIFSLRAITSLARECTTGDSRRQRL
jgi:hypothetical protein